MQSRQVSTSEMLLYLPLLWRNGQVCSFQKLKLKVLLDEIMKKMAFGKASFAPKVSRTQLKHRIDRQKFNGSFTALWYFNEQRKISHTNVFTVNVSPSVAPLVEDKMIWLVLMFQVLHQQLPHLLVFRKHCPPAQTLLQRVQRVLLQQVYQAGNATSILFVVLFLSGLLCAYVRACVLV